MIRQKRQRVPQLYRRWWRGRQWWLLGCLLLLWGSSVQPADAQVSAAILSCRLNVPTAPIGSEVELVLEIQNAQNLNGYELILGFNPQLVEIVDNDPNRAGVNAQLGDFLTPGILEYNEVNPPDELWLNLTQLAQSPPRSGNGVLARVKVIARQSGSANFPLTDITLYDLAEEELTSEHRDCQLQISNEPGATVAATPITPTATLSPTVTLTGEIPTATPTLFTDLTATATPLPTATPDPALATPTPTVMDQAIPPTLTPFPTTELPPTATVFVPGTDAGVAPLPTAPLPLPEAITSTPASVITPPLSEPSATSVEATGVTELPPATATPPAAVPPVSPLALPAIPAPLGPPLSAEQVQQNRAGASAAPSTISPYLLLFLVGILAFGFIGCVLLSLMIYVLVLHLRLSQPDPTLPPNRRIKRHKLPR